MRRVLRDVSAGQVTEPAQDECAVAPPIHHIRFETVSFAYAQREPVLQAFTVSFCAGNNYAVLGRSGIGKSTFVDVLLKFYVSHSGRITVSAGGVVVTETRVGAAGYIGSTRNGITSLSTGSWPCSFALP